MYYIVVSNLKCNFEGGAQNENGVTEETDGIMGGSAGHLWKNIQAY